MSSRIHFLSECIQSTQVANNVYEVVCTKPSNFTFTAGQYVFWSVPLLTNSSDVQNRAFSIASSPEADTLRFVIKTFVDGRASNFVRNMLVPDMQVAMYGPFGNFTLNNDANCHICIATSTGIAPFLSFIEQNLYSKKANTFHLLVSAQTESEVFWHAQFHELLQELPTSTAITTVTQPTSNWSGVVGRVTAHLPNVLSQHPDATVYACGNPNMVSSVKEMLNALHWPKERLRVEKY
jgi:ferredoxin-NADP reductase